MSYDKQCLLNDTDEDVFFVDDEAKMPVYLKEIRDGEYIGKLQFNGTLDFEDGLTFMIFTADKMEEEIQIGPSDPRRSSPHRDKTIELDRNRILIRLEQKEDRDGNIYHFAEVQCPMAVLHARRGLFFQINTNTDEMWISRLRNRMRRFHRNSVDRQPHSRYDEQHA